MRYIKVTFEQRHRMPFFFRCLNVGIFWTLFYSERLSHKNLASIASTLRISLKHRSGVREVMGLNPAVDLKSLFYSLNIHHNYVDISPDIRFFPQIINLTTF